MPANSPVPNQANSQTNQNFNIDISTIYSDFIKEIDANRSIVNIQIDTTALNVLDVSTIAGLQSLLHPQSTPQESRVHAFYRLIGFPVVSSSMQYYNPGHPVMGIPNTTPTVTLSNKVTIVNNPISGFNALSLQRENISNQFLQIFGVTPPTITSSALALTSSTHTRKFGIPTDTSTDPFDTTASDQSYTSSIATIVGKNNQVTLDQYVDELGNTPMASILTATRYHLIKPFIVDGRIDFSVNPAARKVAIPFVPTKQNTLIGENTFIKRPLIEKVITDRLGQGQNTTVTSTQQQTIDYILNVPTVKNDSLIQTALSQINSSSPSVQAAFQKYLFIIQAMCVKLVDAQLKIQLTQSRYYWLPLPSTTGPEGGSAVKDPIISQSLPSGPNFSLVTDKDQDIINATLLQAASMFNSQAMNTSNTMPSPGPYAFDSFQTFDTDTTTGFGNNAASQLTTLTKKRTHDLTIANTSLQTIEIIMGEWSGLGLCDIIAVMGALYIMDQTALVGFLDADAYQRMITSLNLQSNPPAQSTISDAQNAFISSVQDMYNLMDDIYQNLAQNNGLNI